MTQIWYSTTMRRRELGWSGIRFRLYASGRQIRDYLKMIAKGTSGRWWGNKSLLPSKGIWAFRLWFRVGSKTRLVELWWMLLENFAPTRWENDFIAEWLSTSFIMDLSMKYLLCDLTAIELLHESESWFPKNWLRTPLTRPIAQIRRYINFAQSTLLASSLPLPPAALSSSISPCLNLWPGQHWGHPRSRGLLIWSHSYMMSKSFWDFGPLSLVHPQFFL